MQDLGILLILGVGVFGGILGASLFQKLRIPQVVGYIIIGLIIGQSGFKLISTSNQENFIGINQFALGIIGFLVGGELHLDTFKKYGKQFVTILLGEGILSFLLVGTAVTIFLKYIIGDWSQAAAVGVLFGAIASATDPASTISTLWENRAKGVLTTSVIAIVALDDALAMTLYGIASAVSKILISNEGSIGHELLHTGIHLGGAMLIGVIGGYILNYCVRRLSADKNLILTIGLLLLVLGICQKFHLDIILGAMAFGFILCNNARRQSEEIFAIFRTLAGPIYVVFFVLVGAKLDFSKMPNWLWGAVAIYVILRCVGKMYGAKIGAKISKADPKVANYLGMSLFAQGGIAIGLSATAGVHLNKITLEGGLGLGDVLIFGITSTTFLVQFLGPAMVKVAVSKAQENDRDITQQDVIDSWTAQNVITEIDPLQEGTPLSEVINRFSTEDFLSIPVVNKKYEIVGIISLEDMKDLLTDQDSWMWILTADVMKPVNDIFYLDTPLDAALKRMENVNITQAPVLSCQSNSRLMGLISETHAKACISRELLTRQGEAELNTPEQELTPQGA